VAGRFNLAESTLHKVCKNVMRFLNLIAPRIIKFSETIEEKRAVANEFEEVTIILCYYYV